MLLSKQTWPPATWNVSPSCAVSSRVFPDPSCGARLFGSATLHVRANPTPSVSRVKSQDSTHSRASSQEHHISAIIPPSRRTTVSLAARRAPRPPRPTPERPVSAGRTTARVCGCLYVFRVAASVVTSVCLGWVPRSLFSSCGAGRRRQHQQPTKTENRTQNTEIQRERGTAFVVFFFCARLSGKHMRKVCTLQSHTPRWGRALASVVSVVALRDSDRSGRSDVDGTDGGVRVSVLRDLSRRCKRGINGSRGQLTWRPAWLLRDNATMGHVGSKFHFFLHLLHRQTHTRGGRALFVTCIGY